MALVASSSWSHAFLIAKNNYLWPDAPSDREMLADLKQGNYAAWSKRTTARLEDAGKDELLNWACLLGAMEELDGKPNFVGFVETDVLTSNKCFATFKIKRPWPIRPLPTQVLQGRMSWNQFAEGIPENRPAINQHRGVRCH